MKLMITLLTHHDVPRLTRLVNSVRELNPVPGIDVYPVIVVNSMNPSHYQDVLNADMGYPVYNTESNGKPGKGKNACADIFLRSNCDYFSQIDGDDILYPTFVESIHNHLSHFPCIDVLGVRPVDALVNGYIPGGHTIELDDGYVCGVWGTSMHPPDNLGPGKSHLFDHDLPSSIDCISLQSRKSAVYRMDEDLPVAEDHLYTCQLLAAHQKGDLCYFLTMSSDFRIHDRTTENSVQKVYPQAESVEQFKKRVLEVVPEWRSSAFELPFIYKYLLMDQYQKEAWVKDFIRRNPF